MTAEEAMNEIWGIVTPDCGPQDYEWIVEEVRKKQRLLDMETETESKL